MTFFTAQEQMPSGHGFALFHGLHLAILLFFAVLVFCCIRQYRNSTRKRVWQWSIVGALCFLELLKQAVLLVTGQFRMQYLPLDLCGISILFCFLEVWKPCSYFGELLYSLTLPGTLLALFFPNWNKLPLWNFFCMHSFLFHLLLLLLPVLLLSDRTIQPDMRRLPLCFLTLLGCSLPVAWCNQRWGTNFFFLSKPSKGSPLVWFANWFGEDRYWIGFPVLILLIWGIFYLPFFIFAIRNQRKS